MKFEVATSELLSAVNLVAEALGKAGLQSCFVFVLKPDKRLTVYASSSLVYSSVTLPLSDSDGSGRCAVSGGLFLRLIRAVDSKTLVFEAKDSEGICVRSGESVVRLPLLPIESMVLPTPPYHGGVEYPATEMLDALQFLKAFVGTSGRRLDLAIVEMVDGVLYASDGLKMAVYRNSKFSGDLLVQSSAFPPLFKFLRRLNPGDSVCVRKSENLTWWIYGDSWIAHRKDKRSFPRNLIQLSSSAASAMSVEMPSGPLLRAIQRLRAPMDDKDKRISLDFSEKGKLLLRTWNALHVSSYDRLSVEVLQPTDEAVKAYLDARSLEESLASTMLRTGEVKISFLPSIRAFEFRSSSEDSEVCSILGILN